MASRTGELARWIFHPRSGARDRREELPTLRTRLLAAVRAGHGLGAEVRLEVRSGPAPTLMVAAPDPLTARWLDRLLLGAYDRHQWIPVREPSAIVPPFPSRLSYPGRRRVSWPEPLCDPTENGTTLDRLVTAFAALPTGAELDWRFDPLPSPARRWWEAAHSDPEPSRGDRRGFGAPARHAVLSGGLEPGLRPLFWQCRVALLIRPGSPAAAHGPMIASICEDSLRSDRGNSIVFRVPRRLRFTGDRGFRLTETELLALLPSADCPAPGGSTRPGPVGGRLALGRTSSGAVIGPIVEPHQGRHLAILGETGMGKSSLLVALAERVSRSAGLVLFDPLGETAQALRAECAASGIQEVLWIEPSSDAPALNALEGIAVEEGEDPVRAERRLNDLVHALRRVRAGRYTDSAYWGPRLEEVLTRALRTAALLPGGTIVDAHTLLATGARAPRAVSPAGQDAVRELAARIRERPEDAEGARRLLYEVARGGVLERMVCARKPSLVSRDLVVSGRIVIVSGDAARVGESTARYLLSIYLALLWSELLARRDPRKIFVLLDEAQWFAHESLSEMLRLGRRGNVHVVLATQAIGSLPEGVREAAWTNVADFVTFRGSPEEAREFARIARGVAPEALLALPRGHAVMFEGKGQSVHWITTARRTAAPRADPGQGGIGRAVARSNPPERPKTPETLESVGLRSADPEDVFGWLRRRAELLGEAKDLVVSLEELREAIDPSGHGVRRAGTLLGRAGALRPSDHGTESGVWHVVVDRIPTGSSSAGGTADSTASERPQPS